MVLRININVSNKIPKRIPRMWLGINKEGYLKGLKTLFIGNENVSFKGIENTLKRCKTIEHIYFGANRCNTTNSEVLEQCLNTFKLPISIELRLQDLTMYKRTILERCNIIATIRNNNIYALQMFDTKKVQIKLENTQLDLKYTTLCRVSKFDRVDVKTIIDNRYKEDKVIL